MQSFFLRFFHAGIKLREEVECLQGRLESVAPEDLGIATDVLEAVKKVARPHEELDDIDDNRRLELLRRENVQLHDKVAELEAETLSSRARTQELHAELAALKCELQERLRSGLSEATDIQIPGLHRLQQQSIEACSTPKVNSSNISNIRSKTSAFASVVSSSKAHHKNRFRTRTIEKNVLLNVAAQQHSSDEATDVECDVRLNERRSRLGALDHVLGSPSKVANARNLDSEKIAAILRESSPLELQRHLITTTVHNQVIFDFTMLQ